MYLFLFASRVLLSAVFLFAGVSKLLAGFQQLQKTLTEFGVPSFIVGPLSFVLPFYELSIACLLLFNEAARLGAIGALAALLIFTVAITANLAAGKKPSCNCFGQVHSKPIGWTTVARNVSLAALAVVSAWHMRAHPVMIWQLAEHVSGKTLSLIVITTVLTAAVAMEGFLLLQVFRQNGRLLLRIEALEANRLVQKAVPTLVPPKGLRVGTEAPGFMLPDMYGNTTSLSGLLREKKPLLLLFSSPDCGPCNALMPDVGKWQDRLADELKIVVVSNGHIDLNRSKASEHGIKNVLV